MTEETFQSSFSKIATSEIQYDDLIRHVEFCRQIGRPFEAYRAWRLWCLQNPSDASGWANAAVAATNAGFRDEAVFCAVELFQLRSEYPDLELKALSLILSSATFASNLDQAKITLVSELYTNLLRQDRGLTQIPTFAPRAALPAKRRRRIGYFWDSFAKGSEFCFPFHHDRDRFEVIAVAPEPAPCPAEKIGVDRFVVYPEDDLFGAVRTIRTADIDVLVDLNGRGLSNYADLILEARVSPHQAIFGNFFCSVFSPSIDALIGDRAILEIIAQHKHSERLIPSSETFMSVRNPYLTPHHDKPVTSPRKYKYRIGSTGNHLKLSPTYMNLLVDILIAIPDSSFFYSYVPSQDHINYIKSIFANRGVDPDRVELFLQSEMDYYSALNEIDLAIDSIPYNGHLSTYELLAHGTPLWSLRGPRMTQRYGHMLIGHVGLPHQVFDRQEDLIADLVKNIKVKTPEASARLARRVADSGLGDPVRATRLFEASIEALISG